MRVPVAERMSPDMFGLTFHVSTPLQDQFGIITPSSLFYVATHRGSYVPEIDPSGHRLMIHGMPRRRIRQEKSVTTKYRSTSDFATVIRVGVSCVFFLTCAVSMAHAQADTFTAAAAVTSGGAANAPLTIVVQRYTSDGKRKTLIDALKKGGTPVVRALLVKEPDAGSVQIGDRRTPIKYVYARETLTGRQVTVVTAQPIAFAGVAIPAAGFDLGLVILDVDASGNGRGDLVPATKIRVNDDGAFETEDYNGVVVRLSNVVAKGRK